MNSIKKDELWVLIGIEDNVSGNFKLPKSEKEVGLFTTENKAEEYVKKYKLKEPIYKLYDSVKIFKRESPLASYSDYRIELYEKVDLKIFKRESPLASYSNCRVETSYSDYRIELYEKIDLKIIN